MASSSSWFSSDGMTSESSTSAKGLAPIAVYLYAGDQIIENVTTGYFYYQSGVALI